jgi:hypothetical protein
MSSRNSVLQHPQGADREYDFTVVDSQGAPEDISGWTFAFTVWDGQAPTPTALFALTTAAGGIVIDQAELGLGRIVIAASQINSFEPGAYSAQLTCVRRNGKPDVLYDGIFDLLRKKPNS